MTGNRRLLAGLAALSLAAGPAFAQTPQSPPGDRPTVQEGPAVPPPEIRPPAAGAPQPPEVSIDFSHLSGTPDQGVLTGTPGHPVILTYGHEMTVQADHVAGDLLRQHYEALGHVRVHEADTLLTADLLRYDAAHNLGVGLDALLAQRPFTIRASQIESSASRVIARNATVTTAPPNVSADYSLRVGVLSLNAARRRGTMRNVSLYVFHTRLITIRHLRFSIPGGAQAAQSRQTGVRPALGVSGRYGPFIALQGGLGGPLSSHYMLLLTLQRSYQASLRSQQTLLSVRSPGPLVPPEPPPGPRDFLGAIRRLATASRLPLPEGDPLLFHDFLPDPNPIRLFDLPGDGGLGTIEEVSYHVASSGRRHDDLYVSRLPEVSLNGRVPLTRLPHTPPPGDPQAFRRFLRRVVVFADAQQVVGEYREQPTGINGSRLRTTFGLSTRPMLVAPNTVLFPRLLIVDSRYGGQSRMYHYSQIVVALNHYFSNLSAIGLQYVGSSVHGDTPFNFDALDTSQEIDGRLQMGNHRLAAATLVRYDLTRHNVIDYKLAVAPGLRGFTPVLSYSFVTRSYGLGVEIPGLTF